MSKSKIELIRDFIKRCPYLDNEKINVDYIKDKEQSYAVNEMPAETIIKKFTDGGSRRQIVFDFSIQANFSVLENIKNSRFCDDFLEWVEEQNSIDNLPEIENVESIECTGRGTILQTTETTAIYVIPMKVIYLVENIETSKYKIGLQPKKKLYPNLKLQTKKEI